MLRFRRLAWALCASVVVSACSPEGTDPAGGGILKPGATTGIILGTLELEGLGACAGVAVDIDGPSGLQEIVTAGGGTFRVEGLSAGAYAVRARAEGYGAIEEVFVYDAVEPRDVGTVELAVERVPVRGRVRTSDGRSAAGASVAVSADTESFAAPAGITCGDAPTGTAFGGVTALVGPDGAWETQMPALASRLQGIVQREGYTEEAFEVAGEVLTAAAAAGEPADAGEVTLYPLTGFVNAVGGKYQSSLSVDLQVSAFNGAGEMRLGSETGGVCDYTGADWVAFDATPTFTATTDGEVTICVAVRNDRGQEIEMTTDVIVDTTAPAAVQATIGSGGPYVRTNTVNVAVSAVETGSGLATVRIVDNGISSGDLPYGSTVAHTFGGTGLRTLEVFVTDRAGNESLSATATVTVDADAPTLTGFAQTDRNGRTILLTLTPDLSVADGSPWEVRFGYTGPQNLSYLAAAWQPLPSPLTGPVDFTVALPAADGTYAIQAQLRDVAGNVQGTIYSVAGIIVDENLPTNLSFDIREAASTSLTVNLDVSAVDTSAVRLEVSPSLGFASPTVYNAVGNPSSYTYTFSAGPDGERTLYARFCDAADNCAGPYSDAVRIDTQAPTSPYVAVRSGAFATSAAITLDLFAAGADYVAYAQGTSAFTFPADFVSSAYAPEKPLVLTGGDGAKTIWVVFADQAGWMTTPVSATVTLDTAAPNTPTVTLAGGATSTGERLVEVALSGYTPESGLEMRIAENVSFTGAVRQPAASVFSHTLSAGDGGKTVYVQLRDTAGNTSGVGSDGISIDTTPPTGATLAIVGNPSAVSSTTVSLTLSATGASTVDLASNLAFTGASTFAYTTATSTTISSGDGVKNVYARFCDDAGNCSGVVGVSVVLDTTPPVAGLLINNGASSTTNRSATLTISASDTGSGIAGMRLQNDTATGIGATSLLAFEPNRSWTLSGTGAESATKTVYLQLIDAAGNRSTIASDGIDLDNEGPTLTSVTIASGASITSTRSVSVSLVATGADEMLVSQDAAFAGATWRSYASTFDWNLEGADGTKTLYVRLKDSAGNFSSTSGDTIDLDTTPPTLSAVVIDGGAAWSKDLDVSVASTTSGSPTTMRISEGATVLYDGAFAATTSVTLAAGEGARTLTVRVWDAVGLASDSVFDTISVDTEAPSGLAASVQEGAFTTSPNVTVLLSASGADQVAIQESADFSGATWTAYATQKAFVLSGGDGLKTIYVQVRDAAGWTNGPVSVDVTLDESGPTPGATPIVINGGDAGTSVRTVTLTIDAGDADEMQVSESASFAGASWEAAASSRAFELTPGDGVKTVYVRFRDSAGNTTGSYNDTISLDTTPPTGATIAIVGNPPAVSSTTVSLTLGATGASTVELANNLAFTGASTFAYTTATSTTLSSGDGVKNVYARFCDDAANCTAGVGVSVVLDQTAPVGAIAINGGAASTTSRSATLTLSASDAGSGIAGMRLQNDTATGIGATSLLAFEPSRAWTLSGTGAETATKTVHYVLVDAAGNTSTVYSDSIALDNESPVLSAVTVNGGTTPTNQRTLSVALTTSGSPTEMRVSEDAAFAGATWTSFAASFSHTFSSGDGAKTLYVQVRDESGNTSSTQSAALSIDTTGPEMSVVTVNAGATWTSSLTVTVATVATGTPARLVISEGATTLFDGAYAASQAVVLDAGEGSRTLGVRLYDALDNPSDLRTVAIGVDTEAPTPGALVIDSGAAWSTDTNGSVTLTLSATDGGSGVSQMEVVNSASCDFATATPESYATTKAWVLSDFGSNKEGSRTVCARFKDAAGNWSSASSDAIGYDTRAPQGLSIVLNGGNPATSQTFVEVAIAQTGGIEMQLSEDSSFSGAGWVPVTTQVSRFPISNADGLKTIYLQVRDGAGNVGGPASDAIMLDTEGPEISVTVAGSQTYSTSLTVQVAVTHDGTALEYSMGDDRGPLLTRRAFAPVTTVTLNAGEGPRTVYARAWDGLGNRGDQASGTIYVDTLPPGKGAVLINNGAEVTNDHNVTYQASTFDPGSGVDRMQVTFGTGPTCDFTGQPVVAYELFRAGQLASPGPGIDEIRTICVRFQDAAGNWSTPTSDTIRYDTKPPVGGLAFTATRTADTLVALNPSYDAGTESMKLSPGGVCAGGNWVDATTETTWTLSAVDGPQQASVRYRDAAGNEGTCYAATITLDTTGPTPTSLALAGSGTPQPGYSDSADVTATFATAAADCATAEFSEDVGFLVVTDTHAVCSDSLPYTFASAADGTKSLYLRYIDDLGNVGPLASATIIVDSADPQVGVGGAFTIAEGEYVGDAAITLQMNAVGATRMRVAQDSVCSGSLEVYSTSYPLALTGGDGPKTVAVRFEDEAGNASACYTQAVTLDTADPAVSAVLTGGEAVVGRTAQQLVSVGLSGVSGDAVEMMVADYAGFPAGFWRPIEASFVHVLTPGDGSKTVFVKVRDRAGNESPVATPAIVLDTTPPGDVALQVVDIDGDDFALSETTVEIRWSTPIDPNLTGFELQRFVQGVDDAFTTIETPGPFDDEYLDDVSTTTGAIHNYRIRAVDDLGLTSAWSIIAAARPYAPLTKMAWTHDGDDLRTYTYPPNSGTFSMASVYVRDQILGGVPNYVETVLVDNATVFTSGPAGFAKFDEHLRVRTSNQDNSLVQESILPFDIDVYGTVDSVGEIGWHPSIVVNPDGTAQVAYWGPGMGVRFSRFDGEAWSAAEVIDSEGRQPDYAIDSTGGHHVVFNSDYGCTCAQYGTNFGAGWVTEVIDFSGNRSEGEMAIAIGPDDRPHVAYWDYNGKNVVYATKIAGTWVTEVVDGTAWFMQGLDIVVDSQGFVTIGYEPWFLDTGTTDLMLASNATGSWVTEVLTPADTAYGLVLKIGPDDVIHLAYGDSGWGTAYGYQNISTGDWIVGSVVPATHSAPSLALDSIGRPYVAIAAGGRLTVYARPTGVWVGRNLELNSWAMHSLGVDRFGGILAAYYDGTTSLRDLKYARIRSLSPIRNEIAPDLTRVADFSSFAVDPEGFVHVSFYDDNLFPTEKKDLVYTTNRSGFWRRETVDGPARVGKYNSMALDVTGNAHIAYYDETNFDLKYATNKTGAWVAEAVDTGGQVGSWSSLALDAAGKAHIAYYDASNTALKYATNKSGSWQVVTIDNTAVNTGQHTAILVDPDGKVHITYQDVQQIDLKYANNVTGTWNLEVLDSWMATGQYSDIAMDSEGFLHISYWRYTGGYVVYLTNRGGAWSSREIAKVTETKTSIAIDEEDKVHIVFFGSGLNYATDMFGAWTTLVVDKTGTSPGRFANIAVGPERRLHAVYAEGSSLTKLRHAHGFAGFITASSTTRASAF